MDNTLNNKEIVKRVILVLVVIIILLAVLLCLVELSHDVDKYEDFYQEYLGYGLASPQEDPGGMVTICFDGIKNAKGEFQGDIIVTTSYETVLQYTNCEISQRGDGTFVLRLDDGWTPDMDQGKPNRLDGVFYADSSWEKILLWPSSEEARQGVQYEMFIAPAVTNDEAVKILEELH